MFMLYNKIVFLLTLYFECENYTVVLCFLVVDLKSWPPQVLQFKILTLFNSLQI